jgi:hypothetical protein
MRAFRVSNGYGSLSAETHCSVPKVSDEESETMLDRQTPRHIPASRLSEAIYEVFPMQDLKSGRAP